ncbi:hypothetical protein Daus18300_004895 [Diaporthe australafricana]|uniref:Uncharacterized protein n=1 Tax=Diaporthe australafricana TaxID=127596 RepID=A0ABR3X5I1_9PEZI
MMLPEKPPRLVSAVNPLLTYILGAGMALLSLHAFLRPRQEYRRFGLPLENGQPNSTTHVYSFLMFLKGIRETIYGIAVIVLQYQGNVNAVTTFITTLAFVLLVDGIVVWLNGGQKSRRKALRHWFAFVLLGSWAAWRAHQVWEDSEERKWPDGPVHIWNT